MKNVWYSLFALIFLSCSGSVRHEQTSYAEILTPETISFLLSEKPAQMDPGLYLYRNKQTHPLVVEFYNRVTTDREITAAILSAADSYDVPLPLAFSLAWGESSFRPQAVNHNSTSVDRGLFQLNSRTFPKLKEEHFFDPGINARHGLSHLRYCLDVGKSELVALAMYNAGVSRVQRGTPYSTLRHVARILDNEKQLYDSFVKMLEDDAEIAEVLYTPLS